MTLIVFDMGRHIETPVSQPRRRVNRTTATSPTAPVHASVDALTYSADGHQHHDQQHAPQAAAFAADIMMDDVITANADTSVHDAIQRMTDQRIHHLPIIDASGKLLAIVSDRALLRAQCQKEFNDNESIMTVAQRPVYCVHRDTDIRQTARLLCDFHIGALPVIDDQQQLAGIITRSDILRLVSDYGPLELWA